MKNKKKNMLKFNIIKIIKLTKNKNKNKKAAIINIILDFI
jgi:hypothetical protein